MVANEPTKQRKAKSSEVFDLIDQLIGKTTRGTKQKARGQKIVLYAEGLKDKLKQAQFAIESMNNLSSDVDSSSVEKDFSILDKAHFFCDAFWAFAYASLDVTAQIINQSEKLQFNEYDVSFKVTCREIDPKSPIRHEMEKIQKKNFFRNLEKYRNCCLHRRSIYIKEETHIVTHTAGYDVTQTCNVIPGRTSIAKGARTEVTGRRILCDNPHALPPRTKQNREIVSYCSKSFQDLSASLKQLLATILASNTM